MKERGIPPSEVLPDGRERYTVPALFDSTTNTTISDSNRILKYLDETYTDTHQLCTLDDTADEFIKPAFEPGWSLLGPRAYSTWGLLVPTIVAHLDAESAAKYESNFQHMFNMSVEQFLLDTEKQEELWKQTQDSYDSIQCWFVQAEERYGRGKWILGDEIKLPDLTVATSLTWVALFGGEHNEYWKRIAKLNRGRWGNMLERLKPYLTVY